MTTTNKKPDIHNEVRGPGKVPVSLEVNGKAYQLDVEPRRTLLDALRYDQIGRAHV